MISVTLPWTPEEDARLIEIHGSLPLAEIAALLGRSKAAVRGRITRLGIAKHPYWSEAEEDEIRLVYQAASGGGVLNLSALSERLGRSTDSLSMKARKMGLETTLRRRKVGNPKLPVRKFATDAERSAARSESSKRAIRERGHPRGFAGRRHSDAARSAISEKSKAYMAARSDEMIAEWVDRSMRSKVERHGTIAPNVVRGNWKAGWREFGGKRNFYRSRWEANYGRYLQWLKERGEIIDWQHEPETFWFEAIKRGVRSYKPDFRVWENGGTTPLHEVKGWMDDRSRVCLKRMAKYHPSETIIVIREKDYNAIKRSVGALIAGWE